MKRIDLTGRRFSYLLVIEQDKNKPTKIYWLCRCDCGQVISVIAGNLPNGHTTSCGCRLSEMLRKRNIEQPPNRKYKDKTVSARNTVIYGYKRAAVARGIEWALSVDDCVRLFQDLCIYCGAPPANKCQMYSGNRTPLVPYIYNGIDRSDSNRGYVSDNVVSCCALCNRMKYVMSLADFKNHIAKIYARLSLITDNLPGADT